MECNLIDEGGSGLLFFKHAAEYAEYGFTPVPVGGPSGKEPLVKNWNKWHRNTWEGLGPSFQDSNIAVMGNDIITCVDIDDMSLYDECIEVFGDTPIKVATPSGGRHLWYKSNNEKRTIKLGGKGIDILGKGGLATVPPSVTNKGRYHFLEGSLEDIPNLKKIKNGAIESYTGADHSDKGRRNKDLFRFLKEKARKTETEAELTELALDENGKFEPPLPEKEVSKIAASVWGYKSKGELWESGDLAKTTAKMAELNHLDYNMDAFSLLLYLRMARKGSTKPEPLCSGVAKRLSWGQTRLKKATHFLELKERIVFHQRGEKGSRLKNIVSLKPSG